MQHALNARAQRSKSARTESEIASLTTAHCFVKRIVMGKLFFAPFVFISCSFIGWQAYLLVPRCFQWNTK